MDEDEVESEDEEPNEEDLAFIDDEDADLDDLADTMVKTGV